MKTISSVMKKLCGSCLAILTSLLYLVNIYLVKLAELEPSSVSLMRGLLQILIFSIVIIFKQSHSEEEESNNSSDNDSDLSKLSWIEQKKPVLLSILYGFLTASLSFSFILGKCV